MDELKEIQYRHAHQTYDKYGMLLDANQIYEDRETLLKMIEDNVFLTALKVANATVEEQQRIIDGFMVNSQVKDAELEQLRESLKFLTCLEDAGVDNWSGYDYAHELMEEME